MSHTETAMKAGDRETLVPGRGNANAGLFLSRLFSFFRLMQASMLDRGVERGATIAVRVWIGQTLLLGSLNSLSMIGLACTRFGGARYAQPDSVLSSAAEATSTTPMQREQSPRSDGWVCSLPPQYYKIEFAEVVEVSCCDFGFGEGTLRRDEVVR